MDNYITFHDQKPTHNPTTRKQQLYAAADALDKRRCVTLDTDPLLADQMWGAYMLVMDYADALCDHDKEFISGYGQGVDLVVLHICQRCERILAVE